MRVWDTGMREVGAGVFAFVQATGETGISNAGLIVGQQAAIAVDALMVPSMTREFAAAIRRATAWPVTHLVNTHHHLDHTGGNWFFPGAAIVATHACREALAPGFPPEALLRRFMPRFAEEFASMRLALPTVTFDDRLTLHDGEREIHLWHPGVPAHTVGDAVVFLPRERILFTGDLAFHGVTPLAFQGHVGNWIAAANQLLAFEADVLVPGHGPVGTKRDLEQMRDYLALVWREARLRFESGMAPEAAARDIKLGVYARWNEAERILPNVQRCYQEFQGELDQPTDWAGMIDGMRRFVVSC